MQKLLLSEIENAEKKLEGKIVKTPILPLEGSKIKSSLPFESKSFMKLELYQHTGSFKARGNLLAVDKLTDEQKNKGCCCCKCWESCLGSILGRKTGRYSCKTFYAKNC